MTEAEWFSSTHLQQMLEFQREKGNERKFRLFSVACCRRIWPFLIDSRSRKGVEIAEKFSDGLASIKELGYAAHRAAQVAQDPGYADAPPYSVITAIEHARIAAVCASAHPINDVIIIAKGVAGHAQIAASLVGWKEGRSNWLEELKSRQEVEKQTQINLLRDIFGNPFHSVTIPLSILTWQGSTIPPLAQAIYENRQMPAGTFYPARMKILAESLVESGCSDPDILAHCRREGSHVRGCWVIDLLLEKE
jgi:hypothetical protein